MSRPANHNLDPAQPTRAQLTVFGSERMRCDVGALAHEETTDRLVTLVSELVTEIDPAPNNNGMYVREFYKYLGNPLSGWVRLTYNPDRKETFFKSPPLGLPTDDEIHIENTASSWRLRPAGLGMGLYVLNEQIFINNG